MSWDQLLDIVKELEDPSKLNEGEDKYCPRDGSPLATNKDDKRSCQFCGWTPDDPTPAVAQFGTSI